jgi:hypothetical protein
MLIINEEALEYELRCGLLCKNHMRSDRGCDGACSYDTKLLNNILNAVKKASCRELNIDNCNELTNPFEDERFGG